MDLLRKGQTEAWPEVHPELLPFLRPRLSQSCHNLLWFHSLAWLIVTPFSCPKFHTTSSFCASLQKYAQISDVILKTFQLCFYLHGQAAIIMRCPWDGTREGPFVITNLATNHVISSVNIEINNIEYNPSHDPLINIETRTFLKIDIIIACRPSISILPSMMWIIYGTWEIFPCVPKSSQCYYHAHFFILWRWVDWVCGYDKSQRLWFQQRKKFTHAALVELDLE